MTRSSSTLSNQPSYGHQQRDRSFSQSYSEDSSSLTAPESQRAQATRKHNKRDEPASPLLVVFYVVCFYIVWQIFTRNDEFEYLDSTSASRNLGGGYRASLRTSHLGDHLGVNGYTPPYPQISTPSPPPITAAATSSKGLLAILFTALIFPYAQIFNLVFFALHYISVILVVSVWTLHYLTLPVTSILSVLVVVPIKTISKTASALYPLYVLLGGLVGIGVGMGVIAAWLGRELPRWIMPIKPPAKKRSSRKRREAAKVHIETPKGYVTEDEAEDFSTPRASSSYAVQNQAYGMNYRSSVSAGMSASGSRASAPPAIALRKRVPGGRLR